MRMIVDGRGTYFPDENSLPTLARQMDHDLRSPLTSICSYAECLAWLPDLEPGTREGYAHAILSEARRLGRLVGNFVVLTAPPLSRDLCEVDPGAVVAEALGELEDIVRARELEIDWLTPSHVVAAWPQTVLRNYCTRSRPQADEAVRKWPAMMEFLKQPQEEYADPGQARQRLLQLV